MSTLRVPDGHRSPREVHARIAPEEDEHAVEPVKVHKTSFRRASNRSPLNQLSSVVEDQFVGLVGKGSQLIGDDQSVFTRELMQDRGSVWTRMVDDRQFVAFFTLLTIYALFVPDLDQWLGNKSSTEVVRILTNIVVFFFIIEIVVHTMGRHHYLCRAYFWLDLVAMLSLLPSSWMVIMLFDTDRLYSSNSSFFEIILTNASTSARMTRLTRLIRIVRVAALVPRVASLVSATVTHDDIEKLLDKKFQRIFHHLAEENDQVMARSTALHCKSRIRPHRTMKRNAFKSVLRFFSCPGVPRAPSEKSDDDDSKGEPAVVEEERSPTHDLNDDDGFGSEDSHKELVSRRERKMDTTNSGSSGGDMKKQLKSPASSSLKMKGRDSTELHLEVSKFVAYDGFKEIMLGDEAVATALRLNCKDELQKGSNTSNLTAHQTEKIGIKVALGVLLLLFLWNLIKTDTVDKSAERGVQYMSNVLQQKYPHRSIGEEIPMFMHENVRIWLKGAGTEYQQKTVLYLDLNTTTYCNVFGGNPCTPPSSADPSFTWASRESLSALEDDLRDSDYRLGDLYMVLDPDLTSEELTSEEFNDRTTSAAVVDNRDSIVEAAQYTILTTISVIVIILVGIFLLTKDMSFLSRYLLRPLRELADDMESIAQLHMGAVSVDKDPDLDQGTSEIKHIRRTFDHMKKAILSWGKYVPWPVVQLMFKGNIEAELRVVEHEVTMFFSDIASFTTIVERIQPEQSLLLLSRYFNDMSKVIDDHGGVVLEFIGDAILSIYGEPIANADHPTTAVKSALKMLNALRKMNEWSKERGLPEVNIRCGVHTGVVLVGNMGFDTRMKYGIVGEEANIPSRLEELNKSYGTNFLISGTTLAKLQADCFVTRPVDCVFLRSTLDTHSEMIHHVIDRTKKSGASEHPMYPASKLHAEAMQLYLDKDFKQAAAKFENVSAMIFEITGEEDRASQLMLNRCESYISRPPPAKWQGVWDRGEDKH